LPLAAPVLQTTLDSRRPDRQGKVRDIYDFGDRLVIVASDRISAFDYVLGSGIPDKGKVLSQISAFWFARTRGIVPNHVLSTDPADYPEPARAATDLLRGRSMLVTRTTPLRSSVWHAATFRDPAGRITRPAASSAVTSCPPAFANPIGCRNRSSRPPPRPKAATTSTLTSHRPLHWWAARFSTRFATSRCGSTPKGSAHAESCGIIVADTKFEFGVLPNGEVMLIDEMLTPDSSRFWPMDQYAPGGAQPSFDKQFVRDYLEAIRWNKQPPVPALPDDVVLKTREKYVEAFRRLTGKELA
jgi:phosphoribosylaminoimidazole-succinocarboxamide synthase